MNSPPREPLWMDPATASPNLIRAVMESGRTRRVWERTKAGLDQAHQLRLIFQIASGPTGENGIAFGYGPPSVSRTVLWDLGAVPVSEMRQISADYAVQDAVGGVRVIVEFGRELNRAILDVDVSTGENRRHLGAFKEQCEKWKLRVRSFYTPDPRPAFKRNSIAHSSLTTTGTSNWNGFTQQPSGQYPSFSCGSSTVGPASRAAPDSTSPPPPAKRPRIVPDAQAESLNDTPAAIQAEIDNAQREIVGIQVDSEVLSQSTAEAEASLAKSEEQERNWHDRAEEYRKTIADNAETKRRDNARLAALQSQISIATERLKAAQNGKVRSVQIKGVGTSEAEVRQAELNVARLKEQLQQALETGSPDFNSLAADYTAASNKLSELKPSANSDRN